MCPSAGLCTVAYINMLCGLVFSSGVSEEEMGGCNFDQVSTV